MYLEAGATAMADTLLYPELAGRRVLVTGAASLDGGRIAEGFARHGCRLVLELGPQPSHRSAAAERLRRHAKALRVLGADFSDEAGMDRFADAALRAFGGLDVLVNVIGLPTELRRAKSRTGLAERLGRMLAAPQRLTCRAAGAMRAARGKGVIVNVIAGGAPAAGAEAARGLALHALVKTALEGLTRIEAKSAFDHGVRVHGLIEAGAPGARAWPDLDADDLEDAGEALDSIEASALFLASDRGRWLNGAVIAL